MSVDTLYSSDKAAFKDIEKQSHQKYLNGYSVSLIREEPVEEFLVFTALCIVF